MITHYALFWSERDVFWGRQKKRGSFSDAPRRLLDTQKRLPKVKKRRPQTSENMSGFTASTETVSFFI